MTPSEPGEPTPEKYKGWFTTIHKEYVNICESKEEQESRDGMKLWEKNVNALEKKKSARGSELMPNFNIEATFGTFKDPNYSQDVERADVTEQESGGGPGEPSDEASTSSGSSSAQATLASVPLMSRKSWARSRHRNHNGSWSRYEKQFEPIKIMEQVEPLPHMDVWVYVPHNIFKDDNPVLNHIPYFGEERGPKEMAFLQSVAGMYEHGAHQGRQDNVFLNDHIFYHLVKALNKFAEDQDPASLGPSPPDRPKHLPHPFVFEALANCWPDKGTAKQLDDRFRDLLAKSTNAPNEANPSVDDPDNTVVQSSEDVLHSLTSLFCRRCFKYDCFEHPHKFSPPKGKRRNTLAETGEPCGPDCYKHLLLGNQPPSNTSHGVNGTLKGLKVEKVGRSPRKGCKAALAEELLQVAGNKFKCTTGNVLTIETIVSASGNYLNSSVYEELKKKFSANDHTFFNVLKDVLSDSWCAIAKFMPGKLCREDWVRKYSKVATMKRAAAKRALALDDSNGDGGSTSNDCLSSAGSINDSHGEKHEPPLTSATTPPVNGFLSGFLKRSTSLPASSSGDTTGMSPNHGSSTKNVLDEITIRTNLHTFICCQHPGQNCDVQSGCMCITRGNFCEKYCQCPPGCPNRFPGCWCKVKCTTKSCPCYHADRECDPDLCSPCGAGDLERTDIPCGNVGIQRREEKAIYMAKSDIQGWGAFAAEPIGRHEFVSEYRGELISQDEAERRGKCYDAYRCSFLFNLNTEFVVDAARKGNVIKFANHSVNPNCQAKVIMVNGDHRIGIFAKKRIEKDEELFFDYRYGPKEKLEFVNIERKKRKLKH